MLQFERNRTRQEIVKVMDQIFMDQCILWQWCIFTCSDGAATMKQKLLALDGRTNNVNQSIEWNHCIIHRQALASKHKNSVFHKTMDKAVKVINFIKSWPMNSRPFCQLCTDLNSEKTVLLLHSEVCWLSRENVLWRRFQLKVELRLFPRDVLSLAKFFDNEESLSRLVYLTDIFRSWMNWV